MTIESIKMHLQSGIELPVIIGEDLSNVLDRIQKLGITKIEYTTDVNSIDVDSFKLIKAFENNDIVITKLIFKDGSFNATVRSKEISILFKSWEFDTIQIDNDYFNSEAVQKSTITIDEVETSLHDSIMNWIILTDEKEDTINYENADVINDAEFDELIIAVH